MAAKGKKIGTNRLNDLEIARADRERRPFQNRVAQKLEGNPLCARLASAEIAYRDQQGSNRARVNLTKAADFWRPSDPHENQYTRHDESPA